MNIEEIETIHASMINGQRQQATRQIERSCSTVSEFFQEYKIYLDSTYMDHDDRYRYFIDVVLSYHRIKER